MKNTDFFIEKYDVVTSTNDILSEKARNGAPEGTVIIANSQSDGRGRQGRKFISPDRCGIYVSVLLRPECYENMTSITTLAAVAVAKAIEKHSGRSTQIKWVNDVFQNGKKVCGILAEAVINPSNIGLSYIILGIGINLLKPENGFAEEIRELAGAVFDENESFDKDKIVNDILLNIFGGCEDYYKEYTDRDMLKGNFVSVFQNGKYVCDAMVLGIDEDFGLCVRYTDGSESVLRTGEVSVKFKN